jgi:hypothetical protein
MSAYLSKKTSSEWIRYRDGLWIPYRKRTYLYWFKFLQEAARSPDFEVNWRKYRGWGGANEVLGSKFDDWWEDHWKDLFGIENKGDASKSRFQLSTTQPKTEAIRIRWLVWMHRDTPADYVSRSSRYGGGTSYPKRGSNNLAIARKIIATEKRNTYLAPLDPDATYTVGGQGDGGLGDRKVEQANEDKQVSHLIGRYKRAAKKTTENVCEGMFP